MAKNLVHIEQRKSLASLTVTDEFWTSRQRQGHRLHEISYRACFKPQLPNYFIERFSNKGDAIYDPFMGRGTTLLESTLLGRRPIGNDINPISSALVEPRLNTPSLEQIEQCLENIPWHSFQGFDCDDLLAFYHPETLAKLEGLRNWLLGRELSIVEKWIRMVAINRLTGHSSGFFSVYTLPPNQAVSVERQKKINAKQNQIPPRRDIRNLILKKSKSLLAHSSLSTPCYQLLQKSSHNTPEIADESVALTVTSPPFLDVVDYVGDNWLRSWFLGVDPRDVKISQHRTVEKWRAFVHKTLKELTRVTKEKGHIAFEVGEVRGGTIQLENEVIQAAEGLPLELKNIFINQQEFTKTANCWGVANNTKGTNTNRIVFFEKKSAG